MTRAALLLLCALLPACIYWPFTAGRPYGHDALEPGPALPSAAPSAGGARGAIVLHRFESSAVQPIGGVYNTSLVAVIQAPDAPIAIFDCAAAGLRGLGFDVQEDRGLYPAAAGDRPEVSAHMRRLRVDAVKRDGAMIALAEMTIEVTAPGYRKEITLGGHTTAAGNADVPCALGWMLADKVAGDGDFQRAVRGGER
jgi:hypothetical protein